MSNRQVDGTNETFQKLVNKIHRILNKTSYSFEDSSFEPKFDVMIQLLGLAMVKLFFVSL